MNRRTFLQSSLAATGVAALAPALKADDTAKRISPEFYELRLYHLRRGRQTDLFDTFFKSAAIPALNRAGVSRVGVFGVKVGPDNPTMYVLLTHSSLESVATTASKLEGDAEFQNAGADFLNVPATDPAFTRVESSLMVAFEGMPSLEAPSFPGGGKSRLFELRTYESHSQKAHEKKVEMFNKWEAAIFRRTGLTPVFFGKTLIGNRQPNLTYMLAFENSEAHDKAWSAFGADPEWKKVRSTPGYTDPEIVCNISNVFLLPTAYSQI